VLGANGPTASRTLVLVKHSLPELDPARPPSQWALSDEGRERCALLLEHLAPYRGAALYSSAERKALETAQLIQPAIGESPLVDEDLSEHRREQVSIVSREEFQERVRAMFASPDELVFGEETATEAMSRFSQAVLRLVSAHPGRDSVIVTHGTVISLFVAGCGGFDPFPFWRRLGLPAVVFMELPQLRLMDTVWEVVQTQ
jgi:broad specificity phosphatase PhoE